MSTGGLKQRDSVPSKPLIAIPFQATSPSLPTSHAGSLVMLFKIQWFLPVARTRSRGYYQASKRTRTLRYHSYWSDTLRNFSGTDIRNGIVELLFGPWENIGPDSIDEIFASVFAWVFPQGAILKWRPHGGGRGGWKIAPFCGRTVLIGCVKCGWRGGVKKSENFADVI